MDADLQLYDIYDFCYVPFWQKFYFYYIIGALGLLVILWVIWRCIRFFIKKNKTPRERALVELITLEMAVKNASIEDTRAYEVLIWILKKYIERVHAIEVMSKTDAEFIDFISKYAQIRSASLDLLKEIVERSIEVKFARHELEREHMLKYIAKSKEFMSTSIS